MPEVSGRVNGRGLRTLKERSTAQVIYAPLIDEELQKDGLRPSYSKIREMRKEPTIAFARWLSVAPVITLDNGEEAVRSLADRTVDITLP